MAKLKTEAANHSLISYSTIIAHNTTIC